MNPYLKALNFKEKSHFSTLRKILQERWFFVFLAIFKNWLIHFESAGLKKEKANLLMIFSLIMEFFSEVKRTDYISTELKV